MKSNGQTAHAQLFKEQCQNCDRMATRKMYFPDGHHVAVHAIGSRTRSEPSVHPIHRQSV